MNQWRIQFRTPPSDRYYVDRLGLYRPEVTGEKFFQEASENNHYDRRYFCKELKPRAVHQVLISLLSEFSKICEQSNLEFFIVHGTLLGWLWGKKILPWDDDIDISVSFETLLVLQKLQGSFNQGQFILEVNPNCTERRTGNRTLSEHREPNKIDARFIDTHTGLFLDITGLISTRGRLLVSKCPHIYRFDDVYPLQGDVFEGVQIYVPVRASSLLQQEYGPHSIRQTHFNGYEWNLEAKCWQKDDIHRAAQTIIRRISEKELPQEYIVRSRYRRTVACYPTGKKLFRVGNSETEPIPFGTHPGDMCRDVIFFTLQSVKDGEELYWAKLYQSAAFEQLILECLLYEALSHLEYPVVQPVGYDNRYGMIFPYNDELFRGIAVHAYHSKEFFSRRECEKIDEFSNYWIEHPVIGKRKIADLSDFQTIRTSRGLQFIDFTLWPQFWEVGV